MMPPLPSPSLKFRKAGFPPSGFRASLSDRAFPSKEESIAAPGLHPSIVLAASTVALPVRAGETWRLSTAVRVLFYGRQTLPQDAAEAPWVVTVRRHSSPLARWMVAR